MILPFRIRPRSSAAATTLLALVLLSPAFGAVRQRLEPPPHGFFTALPKEFGHLVRIDGDRVEVVLDRNGERLERKLLPGADLFHHGGPATPADFTAGDRVWVVMEGNAKKGERGDVLLLADEISVQDIHTDWYRLREVDPVADKLALEPPPLSSNKTAPSITLPAFPDARVWRGSRAGTLRDLVPGAALRFQSRFVNGSYLISVLADPAGFAALQADQQRALDRQLTRAGLPGTAAAGLVAGDWEVVVDRAGSSWARTLSPGDAIRLQRGGAKDRPVPSTVRSLRPWGERTMIVVTPAAAMAPPSASRPARVRLLISPPRFGTLPPGLGRATSAAERIEWILASIYCTCGNSHDVCTGQLYTLSQCSPRGCPMPNFMRGKLAAWIAAGRTDTEILKLIEQEQGPQCHRLHLVK